MLNYANIHFLLFIKDNLQLEKIVWKESVGINNKASKIVSNQNTLIDIRWKALSQFVFLNTTSVESFELAHLCYLFLLWW